MQTSYPSAQPIGIHGGYYAAYESPDVVSYAAEVPIVPPATKPTGVIPFGSAVTLGTDPNNQVMLGDGIGNKFRGIAIKSIEREQHACDDLEGYRNTETVAVMQTGYAYITCPEGCVAGDPVDFTPDGVFHNGGGGTAVEGGRWEFTTIAGELGVVRIMDAVNGN